MSALDFLTNGKSRIEGAVYINHGTEYSNQAQGLVESFCSSKNIKLEQHRISGSSELSWRNERRSIYEKYSTVITAHHLDDVAEWWIMTSLRGQPRLIPWTSGNVHHPFLSTRKSAFQAWAKQKEVPFLDDPTNSGSSNDRAKIRALMPALIDVYPGIHQTLFGKLHASVREEF
jgi:tRNA(Ile)-lysidine synthase TilS/MesJ